MHTVETISGAADQYAEIRDALAEHGSPITVLSYEIIASDSTLGYLTRQAWRFGITDNEWVDDNRITESSAFSTCDREEAEDWGKRILADPDLSVWQHIDLQVWANEWEMVDGEACYSVGNLKETIRLK